MSFSEQMSDSDPASFLSTRLDLGSVPPPFPSPPKAVSSPPPPHPSCPIVSWSHCLTWTLTPVLPRSQSLPVRAHLYPFLGAFLHPELTLLSPAPSLPGGSPVPSGQGHSPSAWHLGCFVVQPPLHGLLQLSTSLLGPSLTLCASTTATYSSCPDRLGRGSPIPCLLPAPPSYLCFLSFVLPNSLSYLNNCNIHLIPLFNTLFLF